MFLTNCESCTSRRFTQCTNYPCNFRYPRVSPSPQKTRQTIKFGKRTHSKTDISDRACLQLEYRELVNLAYKRGSGELWKYMRHGYAVDEIYYDNDRLLIWACKAGCSRLVELLLRLGANPRSRCAFRKMTAMYYAVKSGCWHIVKMLVERGCNVNGLVKGWSYLYYALAEQHKEVVLYLLHANANVNQRYREGKTALQDACQLGYREIVELLLRHGARLDCRTKRTLTPLTYAVISRKPDVINTLIDRGADPREQVGTNCYPLHVAASVSSSEGLCILLTRSGQQVDTRTTLEETPLHLAVESKSEQLIELLVSYGADVNARSLSWQTPLHLAVEFNWAEGVYALLSRGADFEMGERKHVTPLKLALKLGKVKCLEPLLTYGADISRALEGIIVDSATYAMVGRELVCFFLKQSLAGLKPAPQSVSQFNQVVGDLEEFKASCLAELARMQSTCLYDNVDYLTFLKCNKRRLIKLVGVPEIREKFQYHLWRWYLHNTFPLYAKMLEKSFVLGMMSCQRDKAVESLYQIWGHKMPLLSIEKIVNFLDPNDMSNLILL